MSEKIIDIKNVVIDLILKSELKVKASLIANELKRMGYVSPGCEKAIYSALKKIDRVERRYKKSNICFRNTMMQDDKKVSIIIDELKKYIQINDDEKGFYKIAIKNSLRKINEQELKLLESNI